MAGKKIGVLLAGCGVYDGSEIHEAVLTLLHLSAAGAAVVCMAPDADQHHVINHLNNAEMTEKRNILTESARIARGQIENLADISAADIDALIMPGGLGAAKNLSDFAFKGPEAEVNPEVARIITEMADAGKPIGAICIAPAVLTRVLGDRAPLITIGNDVGTAAGIETMGGRHENRAVDEICVDEKNRLVTTPAYMLGPDIAHISRGIEKIVVKIIEMIDV